MPSPDVLRFFSQNQPPLHHTLFPSLREIALFCAWPGSPASTGMFGDEFRDLMTVFFQPSLKSLLLHIYDPSPAAEAGQELNHSAYSSKLFDRLLQSCTSLTTFQLDLLLVHCIQLEPHIISLLRHCSNLRTVALPKGLRFDLEILDTLIGMPKLEELQIACYSDDICLESSSQQSCKMVTFSKIKKLSLSVYPHVLDMLRPNSFQFPSVQTLSLETVFLRLAETMELFPHRSTQLHNLTISCPYNITAVDAQWTPFQVLDPILSLSALTCLTIRTIFERINHSDADTKLLASSLPQLQSICWIRPKEDIHWTPDSAITTTLLSYYHIIQGCPNISNIQITIRYLNVDVQVPRFDPELLRSVPTGVSKTLIINLPHPQVGGYMERRIEKWVTKCCERFEDLTLCWMIREDEWGEWIVERRKKLKARYP
jgi:hypothetical protein